MREKPAQESKRGAAALSRRQLLGGAVGALATLSAAGIATAVSTPGGHGADDRDAEAQGDHRENPGKPASKRINTAGRMPVIYLPHGGGPCFFMDWTMGPADTWNKTAAWLRGLPATLPVPPKALLVVSAHWEETEIAISSAPKHSLLYDYSQIHHLTSGLQPLVH